MAILIGLSVGCLTAYLFFSIFFSSREEFIDCIKFFFTPDVISLLKGQYIEDYWAELKIFVWIAISVGMGYGTYSHL